MCRSTDFIVSVWVSHVCMFLEYGKCVWNVKLSTLCSEAGVVAKTLDIIDS